MHFANFDEFCKAICEAAELPPQEPPSDAGPVRIMALTLGDVVTEWFHDPARGARTAHVIVRYGPLDAAKLSEEAMSLLAANLFMIGEPPARFAWDATRQEAVLVASVTLDDVCAASLFESVVELAEGVKAWRQRGPLPGYGSPGFPPSRD